MFFTLSRQVPRTRTEVVGTIGEPGVIQDHGKTGKPLYRNTGRLSCHHNQRRLRGGKIINDSPTVLRNLHVLLSFKVFLKPQWKDAEEQLRENLSTTAATDD